MKLLDMLIKPSLDEWFEVGKDPIAMDMEYYRAKQIAIAVRDTLTNDDDAMGEEDDTSTQGKE